MRKISRAALPFIAASAAFSVLADEGMWTYDNFPTAKMQARYGWAPDAAWLKHARLSSIRLAQGCSASLILERRACFSHAASGAQPYLACIFAVGKLS